jgi:hypothetical protein
LYHQWSPPTRQGSRVNLSLFLQKSKSEELVPGGVGDGRPDSDFNSDDLEEGIRVELEHTSDRRLAKELTKDHLTEDKKYYKKLKQVEKGLVLLNELLKSEQDRLGVAGGSNAFPSMSMHSTGGGSGIKPMTMTPTSSYGGGGYANAAHSSAPPASSTPPSTPSTPSTPPASTPPGGGVPKMTSTTGPAEPPKMTSTTGPVEPPKMTSTTGPTEPPKTGSEEEKPKLSPSKASSGGQTVGPAFGEGFAAGSLIGQEAGGSHTGGTTPVTIGTQFGLMKLQQAGSKGASGGGGYFPKMAVGRGPALGSTKKTSSEVSQAALQRSLTPPTRPGARTYIGRK